MPQADPYVDITLLRAREAAIRGAIWAFIGLLYAMLFVTFAVFAEHWAIPLDPYFLAGVMAGTIGAVIYSSMRLAVLMATLIYPVGMIYFAGMGDQVSLARLLTIMVPLGAVFGAAYGGLSKGSRIRRADAKTLAGFTAGVLATAAYLFATGFMGEIPIVWVVGVMAPLTGALYVSVVPAFIQRFEDILPPWGDGALVGGCVAVFIAISSFVMAGSVDSTMVGHLAPEVENILDEIPLAALGGIVGAGFVGVISGLVLTDWQDL